MKKLFIMLVAAFSFGAFSIAATPSIWLIGDATVANPVAEDSTNAVGWGHLLSKFVQPGVTVTNLAQPGMSVKSLSSQGGLDSLIVGKVRKDILIIQLGQNDLKDTHMDQYSSLEEFTQGLLSLVNAAKEKKMKPVLCTPLAQPYYKEGQLISRLGGYAEAVRRVAISAEIPLLDLEKLSYTWIEELGEENVPLYYVNLITTETPEGEYLLNESGADIISHMVAKSLLWECGKKMAKVIKL